jgi:hypothetical protein
VKELPTFEMVSPARNFQKSLLNPSLIRESSTRRKRARQHRRECEDLAQLPNIDYGPST